MEPAFDAVTATSPQDKTLQVRFTGSGSEYFRIWIVNLLLVVATVGLYYPWARIRRLRYFASNTWIGNDRFGEHALEFGGNAVRMLRGYLVMAGLFILYLLAGAVSETASTLAFLLLLACIPLLTWASLRFRLGNTRWRGIQFSFTGRIGGAYLAWLPLVVAGIATTALSVAFAFQGQAPGRGFSIIQLFPLLITVILGLAWLVCLFRLVCYRQDHLRFGNLQTRLDLTAGPYVGLLVKAGLLTIALVFVMGIVASIAVASLGAVLAALKSAGVDQKSVSPALVFGLLLVALLASLSWQILVRSWLVAREQNLVWSHTRGKSIAFHSDLSVADYVKRSLLNGLLLVLTLGLYQPFASIALARLRLDALSISTRGSIEDIVAEAQAAPGVAGDAGADVFGVDVGL